METADQSTNQGFTGRYAAFVGPRLIARGDLADIARAVHAVADAQPSIFEDATGRTVDLDLRGSADEAVARLSAPAKPPKPTRGRPKLGVTAREVTLLPRHWEWLALQPGGASAALRRLVEQARHQSSGADRARQAKEIAYRIMTRLAGNLPGYEEAIRALFAGDQERLSALVSAWPSDVASYIGEFTAGDRVGGLKTAEARLVPGPKLGQGPGEQGNS